VDEWPVYLPAGRWTSLWSGELFAGGCMLHVETPIDRIPVFVRHGAQIPDLRTDTRCFCVLHNTPASQA